MRRLLALALLAAPLPAAAKPSLIECTTYPPILTTGSEGIRGVGALAGQLDLTSLRETVDEETRRAISRFEDANVALQPAIEEFSRAAADLSARLQAACTR